MRAAVIRTTVRPVPRRVPVGRGLTAAMLSALLPGLGQLWAGRWHRGLVLITATLGSVLLAATIPLSGVTHTARLLVQPATLTVLFLVDLVALAFRIFVVIDAYRCVVQPLRQRRGARVRTGWGASALAGAVLTVLLVVTAAPHLLFGYYDLQARSLLTDVFTAAPEPPGGGPAAAAAAEPLVPGEVAETTDAASVRRQRLTIALFGGDAGPLRDGLRTDTIMVATVDPVTGRAAMFSVPRNLTQVPLPRWLDSPWRCDCFPYPINGLHGWFADRSDLVPDGVDPGAAVLTGALEQLLGLPIDHYVVVDLRAFVEVVDALGGVTVHVDERIYDQLDSPDEGEWDAIDLRPGEHHLDGRQALVYVRSRRNSDDYQRMDRQRCFLGTLAQQVDPGTVLRRFTRLTSAVRRYVETDVPLDDLPGLVDLGLTIDAAATTTVAFVPPTYNDGRDRDGYPIPDTELIRETVQDVLTGPAPPIPPPVTEAPTAPPSDDGASPTVSPSDERDDGRPASLAAAC